MGCLVVALWFAAARAMLACCCCCTVGETINIEELPGDTAPDTPLALCTDVRRLLGVLPLLLLLLELLLLLLLHPMLGEITVGGDMGDV